MLARRITILLFAGVCFFVACRNGGSGNGARSTRIGDRIGDRIFPPKDSILVEYLIDSIYHHLPNKNVQDGQERYLLLAWHAYATARNYRKALLYSDSLMALAEHYPESSIYIEASLQRGDIMVALFRYDEAFALFYRAKQIVQKRNDPCILPSYTKRLASVSYRQKRYREAAGFYKQVVLELENCSDSGYMHFVDMQGNLDNIGIMLTKLGMLDSAVVYFDRGLQYLDDHGHRFPASSNYIEIARAVIYGNKGDVLLRWGDTAGAEKLFRASIKASSRNNRALEDAAYTMIKLGNVFLGKNQLDSIGPLLVRVDTIRKSFPNAELNTRFYGLKSRYELARNNLREAYRSLQQQVTLYDSVVIPGLANPAMSVGDALEQVSRQYQLENDNRRKNDYLVVGAFGIGMLLLLVILLYYNYRRGRKSIRTLNELNRSISQKNSALLETLEKLEQMRRDKRQLMHIVAHDLRSPLGSITTLTKMLRQGQIEKEGVDEVLDMIIKAGTSAQSLIGELLEERAKETEGKHEPVRLDEVLQYAAGILEYRASEKQQSIVQQLLPVQLISDREKLQRIFHNLLDNAIKFSPHGAEIRIEMEESAGKCQVRIIDCGIGIPESKRNDLFDLVSSFKRMGTYGEPSYGLGLSIVSQLVRETEGRIWYTSVEAKGTVFHIEYPTAARVTDGDD